MHTRLERLGGLVHWASCMAWIRTRTWLKTVIQEFAGRHRVIFRIGNIMNGITHRAPGLKGGLFSKTTCFPGQGLNGPILAGNTMAIPIIAMKLIP